MSRTHTLLTAAAVVQLGLVAITWWPTGDSASEPRQLVALDEVDHIEISGRARPGEPAPSTPLVLEKQDTGWTIPSAHGYPADPEKVQAVLDKLADLSVRTPVATQRSSHASLNVADEDHGRTVTLSAGDQSTTLVLGSASGTAAHVRLADEDTVYTARGWTAFSIADQPNQFWEAELVDLDPDHVDSLTLTHPDGTGFTLKRSPEGWAPAGEELDLDEERVDAQLQRLANVRIADVVGRDAGPDPASAVRVEWTADEGSSTKAGAIWFADDDGGNTRTRLEGSPWTVQTPTSSVRSWRELTVEKLLAREDLPEMPALPGGAPHGGPPHGGPGGSPHGGAPPHGGGGPH